MKIPNEIVEKLQAIKGINLDVAYNVFKEKRLDVKRKGFVENVIALLIDRELPKNDRGMDFKGLFEVKEIKVKYTKKGEMRTGGDTNISSYLNSEPDFFQSNIWDKSNSILIVCVNERIIVDVRFFNGEPYAEEMKNDYDAIQLHKNLCRKENSILVFKTGFNSIMFKGNTAIDMSESIFSDEELIIDNQDVYIRDMFDNKFNSYQEKVKNAIESICLLMNRVSLSELKIIIKMAEQKIKDSIGFDMNIGSELPF
jgi:hypothetical protein